MASLKYEQGGPAWGWECCSLSYEWIKKGVDYPNLMKMPPNYDENMEFYLDVTKRDIPEPQVSKDWEDKFNALYMWQDSRPGCNRWFMEAYLLLGLDDLEVAARMGIDLNTVKEYKQLFFDLTKKNIHPWMVKYIWEPAHLKDDRLYLYDYILKAAGLATGPDTIELITGPGLLSPESDNVLKNIVQKERRTWALTTTASNARVSNEVAVPTASRIVDLWEAAKEGAEGSKSVGMKRLIEAVTGTIRMSSPVSKIQETKEKIV